MAFSSFKKISLIILGLSFVATSCFKDLDTTPLDEDIQTADVVYNTPGAYRQVLAKLYAGLAVSGQEGPAGLPDISGIDEGFSTYLRQYWKAQELTTDEAVIAWNDGNIHDFEDQDWNAQNEFITAMYNRIYYQISLCNEFIRETTDAKLDDRGQSSLKAEVATYRAEARFLRALSYWHALDMFRNVPFVTEANGVGAFFPDQISAANLFEFIEQEIKEIEPLMVAPRQNSYARADQAALWMLAAKLYLNAEVYIGQGRYTECVTYSKKVIDAGYTLDPTYQNLFLSDNNTSSEVIFPVAFDGTRTQTWGGMTFIIHAAVGGSMVPANFGVDGGWGGTRTTSAFVNKFPEVGGTVVAPVFDSGNYPLLNVPGAYQGWDPANNATALASTGSNDVYEGYLYFAEAGEFKFAKGGWDLNWGDTGADGTLEANGDNLMVSAGFYRLNVDLINLTYTLTPVSWGIIGSATAGGWDSDQNMSYDATEGAWVINADLVAGEVKFRANDGWDINFGDTGKDALLEYGGDNIVIPGAGNYQIKLFLGHPDYTYSIVSNANDSRKMFYTAGQNKEITDVSQFTEGYAITKFKNVDRNGNPGSNLTFPDTDFPMFRLADAYLMYAEAVLRGGQGGSASEALGYVNQLETRAGAGTIAAGDLTLNFLLDERARELYWECHRRTDLVRFGQFSNGTYVWPLKGNSPTGAQVPAFYNVFPIPASDLGANPKLVQNQGYN